MINFICDNCKRGNSSYRKDRNNGTLIPDNWISIIDAEIYNELSNRKLNESHGGDRHFCSIECLNDYLTFKN
jgi:hypothetical protein